MEFGGEIKWISKGVLVSQAMAEHYGRKKERPSRDGAEEYSTNNNSISFSLLLYIAYLPVHSRANFVYFSRSVLYTRAISGTRGSSGFGSVRREQIERRTLLIARAGDHCDLNMSRHMLPFEFMFG